MRSGPVLAWVPEGVYLETVAMPCTGERYSMPLGVVGRAGWAYFRVYHGAGLLRVLRREKPACLLLLAPRDATLFALSVLHELERLIEWPGAPLPDPALGYWYSCTGLAPMGRAGDAEYYSCMLEPLGGTLPGAYTRSYGCIVEALVHASKAGAGVEPLDTVLLGRLEECVRRSGAGSSVPLLRRALQRLLGGVREG